MDPWPETMDPWAETKTLYSSVESTPAPVRFLPNSRLSRVLKSVVGWVKPFSLRSGIKTHGVNIN